MVPWDWDGSSVLDCVGLRVKVAMPLVGAGELEMECVAEGHGRADGVPVPKGVSDETAVNDGTEEGEGVRKGLEDTLGDPEGVAGAEVASGVRDSVVLSVPLPETDRVATVGDTVTVPCADEATGVRDSVCVAEGQLEEEGDGLCDSTPEVASGVLVTQAVAELLGTAEGVKVAKCEAVPAALGDGGRVGLDEAEEQGEELTLPVSVAGREVAKGVRVAVVLALLQGQAVGDTEGAPVAETVAAWEETTGVRVPQGYAVGEAESVAWSEVGMGEGDGVNEVDWVVAREGLALGVDAALVGRGDGLPVGLEEPEANREVARGEEERERAAEGVDATDPTLLGYRDGLAPGLEEAEASKEALPVRVAAALVGIGDELMVRERVALAVGEREGLRVWVSDTVPVLLPEPVADPVEDTAADTDMYIEYEAKAEL